MKFSFILQLNDPYQHHSIILWKEHGARMMKAWRDCPRMCMPKRIPQKAFVWILTSKPTRSCSIPSHRIKCWWYHNISRGLQRSCNIVMLRSQVPEKNPLVLNLLEDSINCFTARNTPIFWNVVFNITTSLPSAQNNRQATIENKAYEDWWIVCENEHYGFCSLEL